MTLLREGLVPRFDIEGTDDWGLAMWFEPALLLRGWRYSTLYARWLTHRERRGFALFDPSQARGVAHGGLSPVSPAHVNSRRVTLTSSPLVSFTTHKSPQ